MATTSAAHVGFTLQKWSLFRSRKFEPAVVQYHRGCALASERETHKVGQISVSDSYVLTFAVGNGDP